MQRLWIPGRLPGLNELVDARATLGKPRGWRGQRFSAYGELKSVWAQRVRIMVRVCRVGPVEGGRFFTYLFREPDRRRDPSNIVAGGVKIVEDALKECGVITNDGWDVVLGFCAYWMVDKASPGATLFITEEAVLDRAGAILRDESERTKEHGQS